MRKNLYLACHVWMNHVLHLTPSVPSGQCRAHIRYILTLFLLYASTSTTSFLYGPEFTECVRATAISMLLNCIFPPLLPLALSFIIIKVRFMSQSLWEVTLHS